VPIQGSATYANEAVLQTIVPRDGKLLVVQNGFSAFASRNSQSGSDST